MAPVNAFAAFFKEKRLSTGLSLREFCKQNGLDWGNTSKLERGRISPPKSQRALLPYAQALGIEEGSDEWQAFHELAQISAGIIPDEVMDNEYLVSLLPLVFRTIRANK